VTEEAPQRQDEARWFRRLGLARWLCSPGWRRRWSIALGGFPVDRRGWWWQDLGGGFVGGLSLGLAAHLAHEGKAGRGGFRRDSSQGRLLRCRLAFLFPLAILWIDTFLFVLLSPIARRLISGQSFKLAFG
jgi:hypothetical protein